MDKVLAYKTLEEKTTSFECEAGFVFGDIDFLFEKLEELYLQGSFIFRGVSNASYKLYSTAQREFLKRELWALGGPNDAQEVFNNWINILLKNVKLWNNGSISEFFQRIGVSKDDDLAYLSFLQHNGLPTPLIDFTFDPFIAIYFATEHPNYSLDRISIDSCFSLYYINKNDLLNKALNADNKSKTLDVKLKFNEFIKQNAITIIYHNTANHKILTSMNIVNQKGCFVFNWHAVKPLEESYSDLISDLKSPLFKKKIHDQLQTKINCINIHKSLAPRIQQELLKRKLIDKEYVYPEFSSSKYRLIDTSISELIK